MTTPGLRVRSLLGFRSRFQGGQVVFALLVVDEFSMKKCVRFPIGSEFSLDDFPRFEFAGFEVQGNASLLVPAGILGAGSDLPFSFWERVVRLA